MEWNDVLTDNKYILQKKNEDRRENYREGGRGRGVTLADIEESISKG